jgi:hypothetical protein
MECPLCHNDVRPNERHCPVCDADAGYPNVRAANQPAERAALDQRVLIAGEYCNRQGAVLERFMAAVLQSRPVICRSLHQVLLLVSSDNELYSSFYGQRRAGSRRPEDSVVERERLVADNLLFPHYHEDIRFAALSLTNEGVRYYGDCSIVFNEFAIASRTTVFEQNSFEFCKEHKLGVDTPVPPGHRAVWGDRNKLAGAKLYQQLSSDSNQVTFRRLLISNGESAGADFVEVHIYGSLHRRSIARITVPEPNNAADEALTLELERRAREVDAEVVRRRAI